jgi:signal peptidase II
VRGPFARPPATPPGASTPPVRLVQARNPGAAFGLFPGRHDLFFVVVIAALVAAPCAVHTSPARRAPLVAAAAGLALGGALGNFHDRVLLGHVRDFVDVGLGTDRWPAFNLADALLLVGAPLAVAAWPPDRPAG